MEFIFENPLLLDSIVLADGSLIGKFVIIAIAVFASAYLLEGIRVDGIENVFIVAVLVIVLDWVLGGPLDWLTSPLSWLTLGLFKLVVDAIILLIADFLLKGFQIKNFIWAFIMAVIISATGTAVHYLF